MALRAKRKNERISRSFLVGGGRETAENTRDFEATKKGGGVVCHFPGTVRTTCVTFVPSASFVFFFLFFPNGESVMLPPFFSLRFSFSSAEFFGAEFQTLTVNGAWRYCTPEHKWRVADSFREMCGSHCTFYTLNKFALKEDSQPEKSMLARSF